MQVHMYIVMSGGVFAVSLYLNRPLCISYIVCIFRIAGLPCSLTQWLLWALPHSTFTLSICLMTSVWNCCIGKGCCLFIPHSLCPLGPWTWSLASWRALFWGKIHKQKYYNAVRFFWESEGGLPRGGAIWPGFWRIRRNLSCGAWERVLCANKESGRVWHAWGRYVSQYDQN